MDKINKKLAIYLETHICDTLTQFLALMLKDDSAKFIFDEKSPYYQQLKEELEKI